LDVFVSNGNLEHATKERARIEAGILLIINNNIVIFILIII
jgi:hypothetical protein